jgi:hypothetical protein
MRTARYPPICGWAPTVDRKPQKKFKSLPHRIRAATTLTWKYEHSGSGIMLSSTDSNFFAMHRWFEGNSAGGWRRDVAFQTFSHALKSPGAPQAFPVTHMVHPKTA